MGDDSTSHEGSFRILTIDGGGIKGVFAASFPAEVEDALGSPLVDQFDLIAGTSTGGIIALGLALGLPARDILAFYEDYGPTIFAAQRRRSLRQLVAAKYDNKVLKAALESVFSDRRLGESRTRVLVPSQNFETGKVHVFKTAHHEEFTHDFKLRVVDVALATSAAPTFFPTHRLEVGTALIDGGMWANNPMGAAAVEALGVLGWTRGSIKLLSVGCTEAPMATVDRSRRGLGGNYWLARLTSTFMAGQSSGSIGTAQLLLGRDNVSRFSPTVTPGRYKLDGIDGIESLRGLGASEARIAFPQVQSMFLGGERSPFTPYHGVKP